MCRYWMGKGQYCPSLSRRKADGRTTLSSTPTGHQQNARKDRSTPLNVGTLPTAGVCASCVRDRKRKDRLFPVVALAVANDAWQAGIVTTAVVCMFHMRFVRDAAVCVYATMWLQRKRRHAAVHGRLGDRRLLAASDCVQVPTMFTRWACSLPSISELEGLGNCSTTIQRVSISSR
jgi:hypothetical protein